MGSRHSVNGFFLAMNGDNFTALDEALAFLDFCDSGIHDDSASSSLRKQDIHDPFIPEDIDDLLIATTREAVPIFAKKNALSSTDLQAASATRKKRRVRSAASSSTVLQRRKKAEIETLRDQAVELEECLVQLKRTGVQSSALDVVKVDGRLSEWHRRALIQYQQRSQSKQTNRRLKEMVEQQRKISNKLRRILHKRNVLEGMKFLRTFESPYFEDSFFTVDRCRILMDELEDEVERVYRTFNHFFLPQHDAMVRRTSDTTYNETCKSNVMEFTTTTPMDWPMRAAFSHVWEFLESSSDRSRKPNTLEAKVNLTLPLGASASFRFHKLHFLRKFAKDDRIIVIWSDLMQMTSKNVRVRSLAHAVFTRSESDPLNACVMYTNLKLYMTSGDDVSPNDLRHGQEVVLGTFGRLMREFWQGEQNRLLEVTSHSYGTV